MNTFAWIGGASFFWVLALSLLVFDLVRDEERPAEERRILAFVMVALAWISILGHPVYSWLKSALDF